jgi:hypothetical protein
VPKPEAAPPTSPHEDKFWNTPVATARALRFTDNLMDEEMEAGDISEISLKSPKPPTRSSSRFDIEEDSENNLEPTLDIPSPQATCKNGGQPDDSTVSDHKEKDNDAGGDTPEVQKMRAASQPSSATVVDADVVSPMLGPSMYGHVGTKIRVNSEVERIVVSPVYSGYIYLTLTSYEGKNMGYCRRDHYAWSSFRHDWQ